MKVSDRVILGIISGVGANLVKTVLMDISRRIGWASINGAERAAGMLIPPHFLARKTGRAVGIIADYAIGGLLGVGTVYALSMTGKDNALLKGALTGQAMWTMLYGALGTMGATRVGPSEPTTVLSEFAAHTAYGTTAAFLATSLGDERLFNGRQPFSATPFSPGQKGLKTSRAADGCMPRVAPAR